MARIRTIKPEFWTSEQIVECSTNARLLFIGLWNFADDGGVHPASYKRLKMEVFPADDCTIGDVAGWIRELCEAGLLVEYQAQDKGWWGVTGWHHQRIDRPNPRHPPPPQEAESSTNDLRTVDDHSTAEGNCKGTVKKKKKKKKKEAAPQSFDPSATLPKNLNSERFREAWAEWCQHRVEIKKRLTPLAVTKQLKRLAAIGEARALAAIEHTIEKQWIGLREPDREKQTDGPTINVEAGVDAVRQEVQEQKAALEAEPWESIGGVIAAALKFDKSKR